MLLAVPVPPDRTVTDPATGKAAPADGAPFDESGPHASYWRRREAMGAVRICDQPADEPAPKKKPAKGKKAAK